MADLFGSLPTVPEPAVRQEMGAGHRRPLADRLRPQTLAEVVGQEP